MAQEKTLDLDRELSKFRSGYKAAYEARKSQISIEDPIPGNSATLIEDPWPMFKRFYDGKHYQDNMPKATWGHYPRTSKPFQGVETLTTLITDQNSHIDFVPTNGNFDKLASKVQTAFNWWRFNVGWDMVHTLSVRDSRVYGIGWLHLEAKEDAKLGIAVEAIPPDQILVAPGTTFQDFVNGDMPPYLIWEYSAQKGELKQKFETPVAGDWSDFRDDWTPDTSASDQTKRIVRPVFDDTYEQATSVVPVYEMWKLDDELVSWTQDVNDTIELQISKLAHPNGVRQIWAGGILLWQEDNAYPDGRFPFMPIPTYPMTDGLYSQSDIGLVLSDTVMWDNAQRILADTILKSGGGKTLVNPRKGPKAKVINNDVAQVIECNDVSNYLAQVPYPAPPRYLTDWAQSWTDSANDAVGSHEISQGVYQPGNRTAQEVAALTESDRTRVRAAVRVLSAVDQVLASMWVKMLAASDGWEAFIQVTDDLGDTQTQVFSPNDLKVADEMGQVTEEDIEFDIIVEPGSTLPTRQQDNFNTVMQLFQLGIADAQAVLEAIDFPGKKALQARIQQQQQMQQAQAQQGEMPENTQPSEEEPQGGEQNSEVTQTDEQQPAPIDQQQAVVDQPSGLTDEEFNAIADELVGAGVPEDEITPELMQQIVTGQVSPEEVLDALGGE